MRAASCPGNWHYAAHMAFGAWAKSLHHLPDYISDMGTLLLCPLTPLYLTTPLDGK